MSEAGRLNWMFLAGAVCFFVAAVIQIIVHNLLMVGAYICLSGFQALAATGSLQEKGTNKYRLTALLAGVGGVLSIAAAIKLALKY